jgi:hypothetical protein
MPLRRRSPCASWLLLLLLLLLFLLLLLLFLFLLLLLLLPLLSRLAPQKTSAVTDGARTRLPPDSATRLS